VGLMEGQGCGCGSSPAGVECVGGFVGRFVGGRVGRGVGGNVGRFVGGRVVVGGGGNVGRGVGIMFGGSWQSVHSQISNRGGKNWH